MATSHVEMFRQLKSELLKDHEAAVGRQVDRQEWEKAMEEYFNLLDVAQRCSMRGVQTIVETPESTGSGGLWTK